MNPPQVYMCSPLWTLLPPPSPYHPSGSSQCTSPKHPVYWMEKTLESLLDCRESILKKISPEYSLERQMLKLKLQYFGHLMWRADSEKPLKAGKDWRQKEKGMTKDEMVRMHCWLDGHEFELAPGVGDGQGRLVCCSPWGYKELDTTEQMNWTELNRRRKEKERIWENFWSD